MSYDIIKAHQDELKVTPVKSEFAAFVIDLGCWGMVWAVSWWSNVVLRFRLYAASPRHKAPAQTFSCGFPLLSGSYSAKILLFSKAPTQFYFLYSLRSADTIKLRLKHLLKLWRIAVGLMNYKHKAKTSKVLKLQMSDGNIKPLHQWKSYASIELNKH